MKRYSVILVISFIFIVSFSSYAFSESMKAKVLSVNLRSEFIVVNKGTNDNMLSGDKFKVFKGSKFLGISQVIETRKDVSAFDISYLDKSAALNSKDVLVLSAKYRPH